ncbi:hypothetical protein GCM10009799_38470 [Nocardiopsis rhodophaea]|uniref:PrsW family intramembrane metalloprotease n=1 Tax=Nocardiopsis rhodophaea TaxID=280238 RepID=A0ABP5ET95_9ACTN
MRGTPTPGVVHFWGRRPTSASKLFQPRRAVWWVLTAAFVIAAVLQVMTFSTMFTQPIGAFAVLATVVWAVWTLIGAWLVGLADVYSRVPTSVRFAALAWGAFCAILLSGPLVGVIDALAQPLIGDYSAAVSAPLMEEAAKYLGVALIAGVVPVLFHRPITGLLCGMLSGLGFSFWENLGYTNANLAEIQPQADTATSITTVFTMLGERGVLGAPWGHLAFTGLTCMGIVYFVARTDVTRARRLLVAAGFLVAGMALHGLNNLDPALPDPYSVIIFPVVIIAELGVLVGLIIYAIRAERRWLRDLTEAGVASSVISPQEGRDLVSRRKRRRARKAQEPSARETIVPRQRAQIAYVDALADSAPAAEVDALRARAEAPPHRPG